MNTTTIKTEANYEGAELASFLTIKKVLASMIAELGGEI